tara:strand:- start:475 stop:675 length:201 start_codon:yes stop_codon:yes gene_type:complete
MNSLLRDDSVFVGFKEASTALNVSISYLQKVANAGVLKTFTMQGGKRKLYREDVIKEFRLRDKNER